MTSQVISLNQRQHAHLTERHIKRTLSREIQAARAVLISALNAAVWEACRPQRLIHLSPLNQRTGPEIADEIPSTPQDQHTKKALFETAQPPLDLQ